MNKSFITIIAVLMIGCASNSEQPEGLTPKQKISFLLEADDYYKKGLLTQAEARYRKALEENPNIYEARLKLGNIYVRKGQLEAAVLAFERCIEIDPDQVRAWNNLALTRVMQATEVTREGVTVTDPRAPERKKLERLFDQLIKLNRY